MGPIGVFDSGYGGLTILREFMKQLPQYDFVYLGDNARAPYGARSYETVYQYTLQAVEFLFHRGSELVIIACNTSSSKALRTIQQKDLPRIAPERRVLGVIRPTVELADGLSQTKHVGIMGTQGTISSESYLLEIKKLFPHITVTQEACPMWVPLVENAEIGNAGSDFFIQRHVESLLARDREIDVIILGCTHYPVLLDRIRAFVPAGIKVIPQDSIVAESLADYLQRHGDMDDRCSKNGTVSYFTSESPDIFNNGCRLLFGMTVNSQKVSF